MPQVAEVFAQTANTLVGLTDIQSRDKVTMHSSVHALRVVMSFCAPDWQFKRNTAEGTCAAACKGALSSQVSCMVQHNIYSKLRGD